MVEYTVDVQHCDVEVDNDGTLRFVAEVSLQSMATVQGDMVITWFVGGENPVQDGIRAAQDGPWRVQRGVVTLFESDSQQATQQLDTIEDVREQLGTGELNVGGRWEISDVTT